MTTTISALEQLLRDNSLGTLEDLRRQLHDLNRIFGDVKAYRGALGFMTLAEEAAIGVLAVAKGERAAREDWYSRDWEKRLQYLQGFKGDPDLEVVLQFVEALRENPRVRMVLEETMSMVVRPASLVYNYRQLLPFLHSMERDGWTRRTRRVETGTITVRLEEGDVTYEPGSGIGAQAAFSYLLQAEIRAIQASQKGTEKREERLRAAEGLRKKADHDLSWGMVVEGIAGGKLCLVFRDGGAALVSAEILPGGESARIEILETTDNLPPWSPFTVSLPDFKPLRGRWPNEKYPEAITHRLKLEEGWKQQRAEEQRLHEETEERQEAIVAQTDIPFEWKERGLIRVLDGEEGRVAICESHFVWNSEEGFIGLVLARRGNDLSVEAIDSDIPFPKELVGVSLPPLDVNPETKEVRFRLQGMVLPNVFGGLRMLQIILTRRLRGEGRASQNDNHTS